MAALEAAQIQDGDNRFELLELYGLKPLTSRVLGEVYKSEDLKPVLPYFQAKVGYFMAGETSVDTEIMEEQALRATISEMAPTLPEEHVKALLIVISKFISVIAPDDFNSNILRGLVGAALKALDGFSGAAYFQDLVEG